MDVPRQQIRRIIYNNEQYVAYRDIIEALKEVADDYLYEEYYDTFESLLWLINQLEFSMIVDGLEGSDDEQE
jgi:hypothetical protein